MSDRDKATVEDIRQEAYSTEKRQRDKSSHLYAYLVVRPLSIRLTPFFVNRGIGANVVTGLGLLLLLGGLSLVALASESYSWLIGGAILINAWYVLDFVDGNIARYTDSSSVVGAFLDWYVGIVYHVGLPLVTGYLLFTTEDYTLFSPDSELWLLIAVLMVLALLIRKLVDQRVSNLLSGSGDGSSTSLSLPEMLAGAITSFKAPLFLIFAVTGLLDIWLLAYALYEVSTLPVQLWTKLHRLS